MRSSGQRNLWVQGTKKKGEEEKGQQGKGETHPIWWVERQIEKEKEKQREAKLTFPIIVSIGTRRESTCTLLQALSCVKCMLSNDSKWRCSGKEEKKGRRDYAFRKKKKTGLHLEKETNKQSHVSWKSEENTGTLFFFFFLLSKRKKCGTRNSK